MLNITALLALDEVTKYLSLRQLQTTYCGRREAPLTISYLGFMHSQLLPE
jgi:hypothetical protein